MGHRIGKVKVYTHEGKLIREGYAREDDFDDPKIFNLFTKGEIIRTAGVLISIAFTVGIFWNQGQNFVKSFDDFKQNDQEFHQMIFKKLDEKEQRIDCLAANIKWCCQNSQNC